eukprot:1976649-Pleurochrysis_carterae.AAC.1
MAESAISSRTLASVREAAIIVLLYCMNFLAHARTRLFQRGHRVLVRYEHSYFFILTLENESHVIKIDGNVSGCNLLAEPIPRGVENTPRWKLPEENKFTSNRERPLAESYFMANSSSLGRVSYA